MKNQHTMTMENAGEKELVLNMLEAERAKLSEDVKELYEVVKVINHVNSRYFQSENYKTKIWEIKNALDIHSKKNELKAEKELAIIDLLITSIIAQINSFGLPYNKRLQVEETKYIKAEHLEEIIENTLAKEDYKKIRETYLLNRSKPELKSKISKIVAELDPEEKEKLLITLFSDTYLMNALSI